MKRRRKEKRSLHRQTFDIWQRNGVFNGEFFFFLFSFYKRSLLSLFKLPTIWKEEELLRYEME